MAYTFSIVDADGKLYVPDPRLAAYQYMAHLVRQGRTYSLTVEAGTFKVESPGLLTLIYCLED